MQEAGRRRFLTSAGLLTPLKLSAAQGRLYLRAREAPAVPGSD